MERMTVAGPESLSAEAENAAPGTKQRPARPATATQRRSFTR